VMGFGGGGYVRVLVEAAAAAGAAAAAKGVAGAAGRSGRWTSLREGAGEGTGDAAACWCQRAHGP
jgi:hypothetical protein